MPLVRHRRRGSCDGAGEGGGEREGEREHLWLCETVDATHGAMRHQDVGLEGERVEASERGDEQDDLAERRVELAPLNSHLG